MNKKLITASSLFLLAIIFLMLTLFTNMFIKGVRVDLTEDNLYTMSDGTKKIVSKIDEPINLYFYYSDKLTKNISQIRTYAQRVKELLQEYESISQGKIKLHIIDPEPYSEEEDKAAEFGLKAVPISAEKKIYLGLAATNSLDDLEIIPFFQPNRESFLEYDISNLIFSLSQKKKKTVGLISSIPIYGQINPRTGSYENGLMIYEVIKNLFDIKIIQPGFTEIDEDIDTLFIVHPKNLPDNSLYAIDQFILSGGKALVMVDSHADIEVAVQGNEMQDRMSDKSSNLEPLMSSWGIKLEEQKVLADENYAIPVSVSYQNRPISHLSVLAFSEESFNSNDIISSELALVNMAHAGNLVPVDGHKTTLTPLIQTTEKSSTLPVERVKFTTDPNELFQIFTPENKKLCAAYRISGIVESAFPDGIPSEGKNENHLKMAKEPINVVVISDVDMLHDQLWVRVQNFFGKKIPDPFADNGNLITNTLENLSGSSDLISIRNRGKYTRPFTLVSQLRKDAEEQYRGTAEKLRQSIDETDAKLAELQKQRDNQSSLLLTPEQEQTIIEYKEKKLALRKELREVMHQLDKDIETLGANVKFYNIALIPFLIAKIGIIILIVTFVRNRKKKRSNRNE